VPRSVTWVVGDTDLESLQPWLHVAPAGSYVVFAGQADTFGLHLTNRGTGPLTITAEPSPGTGFAVTGLPPAAIPPLGSGDLIITYTGAAAPGEVVATYTATAATTGDTTAKPAASGHNNRVALTATTRLIEAVFLVDTSGSMAYTPDGGHAAAPDQERWFKLKTGASQAFNLLTGFASGKGTFGLAEFPDITTGVVPAPVPSSKVLVPSASISAASAATMEAALEAKKPVENGGATPMGHGIAASMGSVAGNFGMFQSAADAVAFNERFLVLQSDGANNSGPPVPTQFYPPGAATGTSFADKKVKVLAVGYGKPGTQFEVDEPLLQALAANSSGYYLPAFADNNGMALRKKLREAIAAGLHLDPTIDPRDVLTPAHPERRYDVNVLRYDTKVAFVVDWTTTKAPIAVSLVTPLCEVITEASAPGAGIFFRTNPHYRMFVVDEKFLTNASTPSRPRQGTWTLIVSGRNGEAIERSEEFQYEVMTESRLKLRLSFDKSGYGTGQRIAVTALLTVDGVGIPNAAVTLRLTAPGQSSANWLARTVATKESLARARDVLAREDATLVGIKAFALRLQGLTFDDTARATTIVMTDPDGTGAYGAEIDSTAVPGNYECYVTAVGTTPAGVDFRREQRAATLVEVIPASKFTILDIDYQFDPRQGSVRAAVRIMPRDQFGNVVMFDPATRDRFTIVSAGSRIGPVVFNGDGSYSITLEYPARTRPTLQALFDGAEVIKTSPVAPIAKLTWVDLLIDHKPGHEARPGTNRHPDPKAALGEVTVHTAAEFVSLGGFGSIVVGVEGRVIVGQGADDITVFVAPDEGLRPYLVEATLDPNRGKWVPIGTSPGVTQSFSLARAGADAYAYAVRITDQSGRVRDANHQPLSTPGISIRGIGVAAVR
jgi:hypothetical protein